MTSTNEQERLSLSRSLIFAATTKAYNGLKARTSSRDEEEAPSHVVRVALDYVFPSVQEQLRVRLLLNVQLGGRSVEEPVVRPSLRHHPSSGS